MAPVFSDVFTEMAVLLLVAAVIGAIGVRLRQPLIVAFIAVGILVGPSVLVWVSANDQVDLLAKLGRHVEQVVAFDRKGVGLVVHAQDRNSHDGLLVVG